MISDSKKLSLLHLEVPLALFYLFYFALVGVYIIFMPKVLISFGYDNADVGVIYAAAPFMRFLIPFVFRRYVALDHRVFLISLASTFVASLVFVGTVENFWLYLVANLLFGASMGIVLPYVETISLKKLSKSRYGKVRLYGSVGFMVIALWLGKILSYPYEALYYLSSMAFLTLISGAIVAYYDSDTKMATIEENSSFRLSNHPWFWVSLFLMQVGFGGYYSFFTIYETSHGVSLEIVSWMWSFGVVCEIVMLYFQGPLLQRNLLTILKLSILTIGIRGRSSSAVLRLESMYVSSHLRFSSVIRIIVFPSSTCSRAYAVVFDHSKRCSSSQLRLPPSSRMASRLHCAKSGV